MQEIASICDNALIPGTMCSTTKEALEEPQLHERNMIVSIDDTQLGKLEMPGRPVKFDNEAEEDFVPAPGLGQHNAEIYGNLNIDSEQLKALQSKGII